VQPSGPDGGGDLDSALSGVRRAFADRLPDGFREVDALDLAAAVFAAGQGEQRL